MPYPFTEMPAGSIEGPTHAVMKASYAAYDREATELGRDA
jgi:hypothetical protein